MTARLAAVLAAGFAGAVFGAHELSIEGPVMSPDEGLLLGNGDLSVSVYQTADAIVFRFGKGDVWDRRMDFGGAPRPAHIDELINGILNEGWKAEGWNARNLTATKGTKDEKRMREVVRTSPVLGRGPYPTPKPVGELRMHLPVDLQGPMKLTQRLAIEEGRLSVTAVWKDGIAVEAEAVVDPAENVLSVGWRSTGWNILTHRCDISPVYFTLTRWEDPDVNDWYLRKAGRYPYAVGVAQYTNAVVKPLPPPVAFVTNGLCAIEQRFYPDNLFPEGFRYRMTLLPDPEFGRASIPPRLASGPGAWVRYTGNRRETAGACAVAVTTSRDRTFDAPARRAHAAYVARAREAAVAYWGRSAFAMPSDRALENLWYATYHARRCLLRGGTVPPGLFFPSSLGDFSQWNGDYHSNYNMHSIYWGDFTANRLDQADAYCDMIDFFLPIGRKIARDYYGARGVFIQLEGFPMRPDDDFNGTLPLGRMAYMTGWAMVRHWEYYQYTRDREWLKRRGYPLMRDCALFYLDFLKRAPTPEEYAKNGPAKNLPPNLKDGLYHAFPSVQGESGFSGDPMDLCDRPQVVQYVRHCLWAAIEAAKVLDCDADLRQAWQERLDNLAGTRREFASAYERHCYLCAAPEHGGAPYRPPPADVPPRRASARSMNAYQYYGHTIRYRIGVPRCNGFVPSRDWDQWRQDLMDWVHPNGLVWGMAVQRWARPGGWTETLSCMAPYQEMLLQSWDGAIRLFPCWPMEKDVSFTDWRAQGAFLVSAELAGGEVKPVTIRSEKGEDCIIHGDWIALDADGRRLAMARDVFGRPTFKTVAGGVYRLFPAARTVLPALAADGRTNVHDALQAAIDARAAAGGGTVVLTPGTYLTHGFFLKSGVTLHLLKGATLLGDGDRTKYPPIPLEHSELKGGVWQALIGACEAERVGVEGEGTVDGQGRLCTYRGADRPRGLLFRRCRNVRVTGVTLKNAMSWMCYFKECTDVLARGVTIYSHQNGNNDGFDIESANVLIDGCTVDSGDDAVCLKSDNPDFEVRNVEVRNCRLASQCCAFKIGTASNGTYRDIRLHDSSLVPCVFTDEALKRMTIMKGAPGVTDAYTGISGVAIENVDGGTLEDVKVSGLDITGYSTPLFIRLGRRRPNRMASGLPTTLRNVVIENVKGVATSRIACSVTGVPGLRVQDVVFRNVRLALQPGGTAAEAADTIPEKEGKYPESYMFDRKALPGFAFYVRHADDVLFDGVRTVFAAPGDEARPPIATDDARRVTEKGCSFGRPFGWPSSAAAATNAAARLQALAAAGVRDAPFLVYRTGPVSRYGQELKALGYQFDYVDEAGLQALRWQEGQGCCAIIIPSDEAETLSDGAGAAIRRLTERDCPVMFEGTIPRRPTPRSRVAFTQSRHLRIMYENEVRAALGRRGVFAEPFVGEKRIAYTRYWRDGVAYYHLANPAAKRIGGTFRTTAPMKRAWLMDPVRGTVAPAAIAHGGAQLVLEPKAELVLAVSGEDLQ